LKLKCDEPLSNFAFNFNLRRYSKVLLSECDSLVGRCRLTVSNPVLKEPMVSVLETIIL